MPPTRLSLAKNKILHCLQASQPPIFRYADLQKLKDAHSEEWRLKKNTTAREFLEFLRDEKLLQWLECPNYPGRAETCYYAGTPTLERIAMNLRPGGYLSHGTALAAHGLATFKTTRVILNKEQSDKGSPLSREIIQSALDRAFAKPQRESQLVFQCDLGEIQVINGKATDNFGVIPFRDVQGYELRVTDLCRTLVDCVVRPSYAGGLRQVLAAYRRALPRISIPQLIEVLEKLDYSYPYHQSLGFLLERAGCKKDKLQLLREKGTHVRFYVDHAIPPQERGFDKSWQVYYPNSLSS